MIATDLAQGRLIELKHYLAQFRGFRMPGRKALPVNFAQRPNQGVAVLAADFAILCWDGDGRDPVCSCCSPASAGANRVQTVPERSRQQ